ncbi:SAC3 family protein A-like isoform X1 [Papaver somniferum]|uniref:SAC3 family protein A-like isoform X1 n=2 Tax=Papaver somniferum TaxID=3469 RepID=UPI000E6F8512|nr:SAC3 family protein A-like isoform X1 [Papaver somniferum]XP_026415386.1 SAC3 family protein A-like isoform X1 [Papaver somniferum]
MMHQGGGNIDAYGHQFDNSLQEKNQVADVNQGQSSVYPSFMLPPPPPLTGSQPAPWAMHRTENSSVDNAVHTNTGYHPEQKTDPPPRNVQDGLNTSSHAAASSTVGVANGTPDYSGYASYSTSNDPYGYGTTGYQNYYYGYQQQANQPYTPQVGGPQNSGAPYQPLTSFQNSGSYAGSASYSSTYYNTGDYQTSGGLASSDYGSQTTQANLWNDASYANYPSHQYSGYTPADSSSARSSSTVAPAADYYEQHYKQQWADYYSQTSSDVTCAPGTENKSTTGASTHGSQIPGVPGGYPISHTQPPPPPPPGTTSWQPQVNSSGTWDPDPSLSGSASWRPESISAATTSWKQEPTSYGTTSWKPEPTPSNTASWRPEPTSSNTTSWRPEPTPSNSTSWKPDPPSTSWKPEPPSSSWTPEPTPSSTTSWRPEPTSTSTMSWRPEPTSSGLPTVQQVSQVTGDAYDGYWRQGSAAFQNHHVSHTPSHFQKPLDPNPVPHENSHNIQQTACSQGPTSHFPATHHGAQTYASVLQSGSSMDTRRANKLQIATNPRIAQNVAVGLPKTDKDGSTNDAAAKPAYISVLMSKPGSAASSRGPADSVLKPGAFPVSLRAYVERALSRCKDDLQKAACQNIMKEMITRTSSDGTLFTKDWDTEPLFPLPEMAAMSKELQSSSVVSSLPKYKQSPSRRTKSRWEPIAEEKLVEKMPSVTPVSVKSATWNHAKEKDKTVSNGKWESKDNSWTNGKFVPSRQQTPGKSNKRSGKKPRLGGGGFNAAQNNDASDSDKEQGLTAYYSGAAALANHPDEKKKREDRCKRFDRGPRAEMKHFRPKNASATANLYTRKASALVLSKSYEDSESRAVEDIDWDSLTVKGTCQEIEKRYLRLTSAPDPTTVRPENVLEKALLMVQNSQKNYLYKCDQLKSIRQDLTVQRIINVLTVKVYETHARLALEAGDLPEFNQCQSQLQTLYSEGIKGCQMEFSAYSLLCVILHSNNNRDLVASMARLPKEAKKHEAVKHALAVRTAVTSGNYVLFFRLYKAAPNLSTCLMDLYVEKMRFEAVKCMSKSYRPTVPVSFVAQVLGFTSSSQSTEGKIDEKDTDGLEECEEWLKAHGACLNADSGGELQFDTKASSSSLFMPEPEDAVAHGDTSLAVNDFMTRTS